LSKPDSKRGGANKAIPRTGRKRLRSSRGTRIQPSAFLNVPYDEQYEPLYLAFIAGLCGFGLVPRATLEIPTSDRRLDRIVKLMRSCRYSFHDLSRIQVDREKPRTPRFNMPFELGLAVAWAKIASPAHRWVVLEEVPYRLTKSLSDLNGTDPLIHHGNAEGVLEALSNALYRNTRSPNFNQLEMIYRDLKAAASQFRSGRKGGSLFEARAFKWLVLAAQSLAEKQVAPLIRRKRA